MKVSIQLETPVFLLRREKQHSYVASYYVHRTSYEQLATPCSYLPNYL